MMDTGHFKEVADVLDQVVVMMVPSTDLDRTSSSGCYVRLDSRAVSEVQGVKALKV